jgi:hypothetical protein
MKQSIDHFRVIACLPAWPRVSPGPTPSFCKQTNTKTRLNQNTLVLLTQKVAFVVSQTAMFAMYVGM